MIKQDCGQDEYFQPDTCTSQFCFLYQHHLLLGKLDKIFLGQGFQLEDAETLPTQYNSCFYYTTKKKHKVCLNIKKKNPTEHLQQPNTIFFNIHFSSVHQSCLTLFDPMDCSTPGLPVHHQLPEFTQTHVHLVSDVIQPSHPLSSPSPAFNLSQHQGLS